MSITLTFTLSGAVVVTVSILLLVATTVFCWIAGLFDGPDPWGIGWLFGIVIYGAFWVTPSLVAWAAWATWFRGPG